MIIYLDLDGVCVNLEDYISQGSALKERPVEFWRNLKEYIWFPALYKELSSLGEVYFLSSIIAGPNSATGKCLWLEDRFGNCDNLILTIHKHLLSSKDTVLIDDYIKNIDLFNSGNGRAFLFPQPWNMDDCSNRLERAVEFVKKFKKGVKWH